MISVGIYGGKGYMGGEALRVILEHPQASLKWITSREGGTVRAFHPNLIKTPTVFSPPDRVTPCDVVFFAAPTGVAMETVPSFLEMGCRIIDLGPDFRLRSKETWERLYDKKHLSWDLAVKAVYGLTELRRQEVRNAKVVACPGCFSTASILAIAPAVANGLVELQSIVITGLSGTAGMGAEECRPGHHPEIASNLVPYNMVDHRHSYEMEQELTRIAGAQVRISFSPVYVPIVRGILTVCTMVPIRQVDRQQLLEIYRSFYKDEHFVCVHDAIDAEKGPWRYQRYPWVSTVSGTNFCQIGLDYDVRRERIVSVAVLDSLGKGGAHQGVQNMNLMFGLDECEGLGRLGNHPY